MRHFCFIFLFLTVVAAPCIASSVDYTTAGTYSVPSNCGFTVLSTSNGWIRMTLTGDAPAHTTDLLVRAGESYPLILSSVTIYSESAGGAYIRVNTTPSCACSVTLDPVAPIGQCYTRSLGFDYCEEDFNRPMFNDPEAVPPGPDISFTSSGFYGSGEGEIDTIGILQSDWGYWNTVRLREGEWSLGGIRRCRTVDGSSLNYLTLVAP